VVAAIDVTVCEGTLFSVKVELFFFFFFFFFFLFVLNCLDPEDGGHKLL
jgi:hypothetical protein